MTRLGLFIKLYFFSWTWFLLLGVVLSNDETNNDDALEVTGKSLKISQACAPHSRSRHTVDVQSVYLSCWEEEDENGNVGNDGNYYPDSFSDLSYICRSGETARLVVDFWLKKFTSDTMVLIDLTTMYAGTKVTIVEAQSLCEMEKIILIEKSQKGNDDDDDDAYMEGGCSLVLGKYRIFLNFEVPDFGFHDCELTFTPDFRIQFFDSSDNFKIGCVDTGSLANMEIRSNKAMKGEHVFMAVIFFLFLVMFCIYSKCREKIRLSPIDRANRRALRRFHYRQSMEPNNMDADGNASVASSISSASAWSRKQFT